MNRKTILLGLAVCSLSVAAAVSAPRMQPGLWKMSTAVDTGMAMPKMPPEAMAMMKARGMNIPMPGQPMVTQVCITPDQAAQANPATAQQAQREIGCTMTNVKQGANTYSADMVCTGDTMKGKGHTDVVYSGSNHYQVKSSFTGTAGGRQVNTKTEIIADFVSANCGSVKPYAMPKGRSGN